jgi:PAS domain S-box-containing protein
MDFEPEAESRAFAVLGRALATNPDEALQRVAECALTLCHADAAGILQLEGIGNSPVLRWHAVAGETAISAGAVTQPSIAFSHLVRRNELTQIGRNDPRAASLPFIDPRTRETMVLPWAVDGAPVGAICITRNIDKPFDRRDSQRLQILGSYASAAWQVRTARAGSERLLGLFRQAPGFMAILRGPDHIFEFYNDSFTRLVGPRDLIGHPVRDVFPEVEGQGFFEWLDSVYRSGGAHIGHATPLRLHSAPGGPLKQLFVDFIYQAITDSSGRTTGIFVEGHDVTAQVRSATALKESETRLRTLTEGIPQLVWRAADQGLWTWSSPQWQTCTGLTCEQSQGRGWLRAIHNEDRAEVLLAWQEAGSRGSLEVEHRVWRASDGAWLWHHTRALPVTNASGEVIEWLGTSTEVQQLKQMQDRQAVLVSELQHRTRNLIAVIRSIAEQTASTATSLQEFGSAFDDRLAALGRVQTLLSRVDADPITIETLVRMELDSVGAFGSEEHSISLAGPNVPIRQSLVQTLALALHELATNARKHGALASEGGRLKVSWNVEDGKEKGAMLTVQWIEEGSATISVPVSSPAGFGRYLLERALPYLGAATHFALDENGARCDIEVPLGQHAGWRQHSLRHRESGFS